MFDMINDKKHIEDGCTSEGAMVEIDYAVSLIESEDSDPDALANMETVAYSANKIRKQNPIKAMFSSGKNDKRLAENDELILGVIRNMLNWLAVITSAETVRKDEYDSLISQMLRFNDDINDRLKMDIKFKRAYETMMQKQEEQAELKKSVDALKKENMLLKNENKNIKILLSIAILLGVIAIIISL